MEELVYRVKGQLSLYDEKILLNTYYGYGNIDTLMQKVNELSILNRALFRSYVAERRLHDSCLKSKRLQALKERVIDRVCEFHCELDRLDIEIDRSGFSSWAAAHPNCVPKEKWEIYCHEYLCDIGFDMVAKSMGECLIFDIVKQDITPNLLFLMSFQNSYCNTELNPDVRVIDCNVEFQSEIKHKECKMSFDALRKNYDCNIDFEEYKKVYECTLSHELIREFYNCGVELGYNTTKQCLDIIIGKNTYPACELNVQEVSDINLVMNLKEGYVTAPEIIEKIKKEING